jgi:hypothetical protein
MGLHDVVLEMYFWNLILSSDMETSLLKKTVAGINHSSIAEEGAY